MLAPRYSTWPALLTGTIIPDPRAIAVLTSPVQRESHYLDTLKWMASSETGIRKVVFCENSQADLGSFYRLQPLFERNGRTLELVRVPKPDPSQFFGKGWAEAQMIDWALEHVETLGQASAFIKITGRYKVLNLGKLNSIIRRAISHDSSVRFIGTSLIERAPAAMDSSIFWSDREFFVNKMSSLSVEVDDINGTYLEHVLARRLLGLAELYRIGVFPIEPIVWARRGGNGSYVMRRRVILALTAKQLFYMRPRIAYLRSSAE